MQESTSFVPRRNKAGVGVTGLACFSYRSGTTCGLFVPLRGIHACKVDGYSALTLSRSNPSGRPIGCRRLHAVRRFHPPVARAEIARPCVETKALYIAVQRVQRDCPQDAICPRSCSRLTYQARTLQLFGGCEQRCTTGPPARLHQLVRNRDVSVPGRVRPECRMHVHQQLDAMRRQGREDGGAEEVQRNRGPALPSHGQRLFLS